MKIVFRKDIISAAVSPLMSGVSTKMTLAATEGILIEATLPNVCIMTTYDIEKGVRISVEADVIEAGAAIISASKLSQIVRVMDGGDITLVVDEKNCATIFSGRSSHTLTALPAGDFPEVPRLTSTQGFTAPQRVVRNMMGKCTYAMGVNDQRPVLNGLFFSVTDGRLHMVSCDSFKMATCATEADLVGLDGSEAAEDANFILPNKSVSELYKLLNDKDEEALVTVYTTRKNIIFVMGDITFFSKLIEGEYIDYNRIIMRNHRIFLSMDREAFISALEHAALITEEKVAGSVRSHVRLETEGNILKISATSGTGSAYDEVAVVHEGDDITIAFNNRYLIDSLRACNADRIKISMSSPLTSINIEPDDDDCKDEDLFMLLPVRMKE
ncbi:MAG: DNA polymerase III subunit beta [Ruminococcaceae bacterium]|nr:DNA polymerase III subunit beta [Oscillospiraceae bacterium]